MPSMSVLMRSSISLNKRAQLVDRVAIGANGHARFGVPGASDPADRGNQTMDRLEHPPRHQDAAGKPGQDDGDRHERDDRAETVEQLLAVLGALADLEQRAVGEPRRRDLEPRGARARLRLLPESGPPSEAADVEVAPFGRHAGEERFDAGADDPHEQALVAAGSLFEVHRPRERGEPALRHTGRRYSRSVAATIWRSRSASEEASSV